MPTLDGQPLPIFPELDPLQCENPDELEGETAFKTDELVRMISIDRATTLPNNIINS